jgi:hypothetical protein
MSIESPADLKGLKAVALLVRQTLVITKHQPLVLTAPAA